MWNLRCAFVFVVSCFLQVWSVESKCTFRTDLNGTIAGIYEGPTNARYYRCWKILNPEKQRIDLEIGHLNFYDKSCSYINLQVEVNDTGRNDTGRRKYKICGDDTSKKLITSYSDIEVNFYVDSYLFNKDGMLHFWMTYKIDTGIRGVRGIENARAEAVSWVKSKVSSSWGWIENVSKAVVALFLSGGANFNGTNVEEQLMVEQRELRVSVSLLRNTVSTEQLSVFINSLLVTCHSPRRFYGVDLIKRLKNQLGSSNNFSHPIVYLALCNAKEPWPITATADLSNILNATSEYPFMIDVQAIATMALSCQINRTNFAYKVENQHLMELYDITIQQFKEQQLPSGNFGNIHTTSLITQALVSSGHEYEEDWKPYAAIKYLMKELNSSRVNFLATYWALPLLNGKTLTDIAHVNCSGRSRNHDDLVSEIHDHLGPKMRVQYSLFIGENREVIHTMSLQVPQNFTAYDVMQYAEVKDVKYSFLWERVSGKMYVYDISKIPNDSEEGKFWLLYLGSNKTETIKHSTSSPDKIILHNGDHLIMWYKTTSY